jgi:hypothetical protein
MEIRVQEVVPVKGKIAPVGTMEVAEATLASTGMKMLPIALGAVKAEAPPANIRTIAIQTRTFTNVFIICELPFFFF